MKKESKDSFARFGQPLKEQKQKMAKKMNYPKGLTKSDKKLFGRHPDWFSKEGKYIPQTQEKRIA